MGQHPELKPKILPLIKNSQWFWQWLILLTALAFYKAYKLKWQLPLIPLFAIAFLLVLWFLKPGFIAIFTLFTLKIIGLFTGIIQWILLGVIYFLILFPLAKVFVKKRKTGWQVYPIKTDSNFFNQQYLD